MRKGRREKAGNLREVQAIIFANANPAHSEKSQNRRSAAFRESLRATQAITTALRSTVFAVDIPPLTALWLSAL